MRTRPVRPNHKGIILNFISDDSLLTEKARSFFSRTAAIRVVFGTEPIPEEAVDCYAVEFKKLSLLLHNEKRPDTWLPVIAFGPRHFLPDAFHLGCVDYLKDPWDAEELAIRVKKIFVLTGRDAGPLSTEGVVMRGNRLETGDHAVILSQNEKRILNVLLASVGEVVPRDVLYYAIWGKIKNRASRVVDVHVSSLRKKTKNNFPWEINQVRGEGYLLSLRASAASR